MKTLFTESEAILSKCGKHRYLLTRAWEENPRWLGWVMLNPSTADADKDDPTIRKCIGFARHKGFGGIIVVNLFSLRATDPGELRLAIAPVSNGAEHYGDWEVMEILEKYADSFGVGFALKHLLRKPKAHESRVKDLKKAVNYLQREVDILEGKCTRRVK